MGRGIKGIIAAGIITLMSGSMVVSAAVMETPYIAEQAVSKAPELKVYLTGSKMNKNATVTGELDNVSFVQEGEIRTFAKSGETMNYIILMDNSGSVNETQFDEVKTQLTELRQSLKKGDEMTLYTVGTDDAGGQKTKIFSRKVKNKEKEEKEQEDCKKIAEIPYLKTANSKTVLYRSVNQVLKEQTAPKERTVLLLITDGEDDSQGKDIDHVSTAETVKEASVPVYGIILNRKTPKSGKSESDEKISYTRNEILAEKNCRGYYYDCSLDATKESVETAFDTLETLWKKETYVVNLKAPTNQTVGRGKLKLTVDNSAVSKIYVDYSEYEEDKAAPVMSGKVEEINKNTISFVLEDKNGVNNVDVNDLSNYMIQVKTKNDEGEVLNAESVNTAASGKQVTVTLTMREKFCNGDYILKFANIRDRSQDQNEMDSTVEFTIKNGQNRIVAVIQKTLKAYWWIILLLLVAGIGAVIIFVLKKKKTEGSNINLDELEKADSKKIRLRITDRAGMIKDVEWNVEGSLFVGRSNINNIYFDDERLSKQHFVLEVTKMGVYILDLDSTNGTFVNGVKITNRRMLLDGDEITAGREKIVIYIPKEQLELQENPETKKENEEQEES